MLRDSLNLQDKTISVFLGRIAKSSARLDLVVLN